MTRYTHRVQYESGRGHGLKTAYVQDNARLTVAQVWQRLEAITGVPPLAVYDLIIVENPQHTGEAE